MGKKPSILLLSGLLLAAAGVPGCESCNNCFGGKSKGPGLTMDKTAYEKGGGMAGWNKGKPVGDVAPAGGLQPQGSLQGNNLKLLDGKTLGADGKAMAVPDRRLAERSAVENARLAPVPPPTLEAEGPAKPKPPAFEGEGTSNVKYPPADVTEEPPLESPSPSRLGRPSTPQHFPDE